MAPRTDEGKMLTIAYSFIGIPLMLLYLTIIGSKLAKMFRYIYGRCCCGKTETHAHDRKEAAVRARCIHLQQAHQASVGAATLSWPTMSPTTTAGSSATLQNKHVHTCNHHTTCNNVNVHTCNNHHHASWTG